MRWIALTELVFTLVAPAATLQFAAQPIPPRTQGPAQPDHPGIGTLSGRVLLSDGSPASNLKVTVMRGPERNGGIMFWTNVGHTRTDTMGRYRMEAPPGLYTIVTGSKS